MNKKGFTLQEALITVGIIGIVAAITVPAITKIIPNQYQTKYLKAYAAISSLTKDMLMDSNLYWYGSENINGVPCDGLLCSTVPTPGSVPDELIRLITNNGQINPTWVQKYAAILAYNMQIQNFNLISGIPSISATFTTSDGSAWTFSNIGGRPNDIIVDINVDPNANLIEDIVDELSNIPNNIPNLYSIIVNSDGNVTPVGPYSRTYLDDPDRILNKKDTIQIAEGKRNGGPALGPSRYSDNVELLCRKGYTDFCKILERIQSGRDFNESEGHRMNGD